MKGYLQRIAASAMQPVSRVHPVVRPLFAAARDEMAEDALSITLPAEPAAGRRSESADTPPAPRVRPEAPLISAERPHARDGAAEARATTPTAAAEEREPAQYRPLIAARAAREADEVKVRSSQPEEDTGATEPQIYVETRSVETPGRTPAAPLLPPRHDLRTATAAAFPASAGRRRAAAPIAQMQPDQIEIHIGRIEVTAVPPAQPRPVHKPARMSLNLDEYLKRGR